MRDLGIILKGGLVETSQEALGKRIRVARERLGITQAGLAQRVGLSAHQIVSQIEKGHREVKAWELAKIAEVLHVEFSSLLSEARFKPEPVVLWREQPKREAKEIEAGFLKRCREYHWLEELCEIESPGWFPRYDADAYSASTLGAAELAKMVGNQLNLGARPATSLAKILEEVYGVKIWYERLKNGGSGACVAGDFGPAMLVNSSEAPWRRNYDIAHELFHLLTWESFPPESLYEDNQLNRKIEQAADTFASWLLLPADAVLTEFDRQRERGAIKYGTIVQMARDFDVSTEALLWCLERLGRISASEVDRVLNDSAFRSLDKATMHKRWWTPLVPPERFVRLAFFAYQRGRLSRARLAELLDTSLFNLTDKLLRYGLDDREDYETEISST